MILMLVVGLITVPLLVTKTGGIESIINGLGGINKDYLTISLKSWDLFLNFGLTTTIGLLSGPIGDQSFWQRTFSMNKNNIKKAYIKAAIIFAIIPLLMAVIGFSAAGIGFIPKDTGIVNLEYIIAYLSPSFITLFVIMLVSGLSSTLDSNLCAISSIIAVELKGDIKRNSRIGMILLTIAGLLIANVPNMPIVTLFLIYGVLRTSVFAGTVTTILSNTPIKKVIYFMEFYWPC